MYSSVWKILSHESIPIEKAKLKLRERFTNKQTSNKQRRTLLVIDEVSLRLEFYILLYVHIALR